MKITFAILLLTMQLASGMITVDEFKDKWSSPFHNPTSQKILIGGSLLTAGFILNKKGIIDPIQKAASEDRPLGIYAHYGETMGMAIPNLIYFIGMYNDYNLNNNHNSLRKAAYMFDATIYTGITTVMLKYLIGQERPNKRNNFSFPSGHASSSTAFATVIALEHEWYWGLLAGSTAAIVGYSRINDNAHYLHDVIFGTTLGISYAWALKKFHTNRTNEDLTLVPIFINDDNFSINISKRF